MKYKCTLLAVKDVDVSKKFYAELFDQTVAMDLGLNVTFSGGFAVQQDFAWLCGIPKDSVNAQPNNMELYFEVDDFDAFLKKLAAYDGIEYVTAPKTYDWKQRVVRIYDPDRHIIEIGESMAVIARRYLSQGVSVEETAAAIQHPVEFVQSVKDETLESVSELIETERLILRTITPDDALDIYNYASEENVGPNAGWKPHESIEETREIMNAIFVNQRGMFGIVPKELGKVIGTVGLIEDPKRQNPKAIMLGYAMSEKHWGKGYMTEAAKAVVDYAFNERGYELVSAYCYPDNARSEAVIRKCGFQYEGTMKQSELLYNGKLLDNKCFVLTKNEKQK